MSTYKINVKHLTDKVYTFDVTGETTVANLKTQLESASDLPAAEIKLICRGGVLKTETDTLKALNIGPDSTILMFHQKSQTEAEEAESTPQSTPQFTPQANPFAGFQGGLGGFNASGLGGPEGLEGMGGLGIVWATLARVHSSVNNPQVREAAQNLIQNPEMLRDMIQNNPEMLSQTQNNPMMQQMLNNPAMMSDMLKIIFGGDNVGPQGAAWVAGAPGVAGAPPAPSFASLFGGMGAPGAPGAQGAPNFANLFGGLGAPGVAGAPGAPGAPNFANLFGGVGAPGAPSAPGANPLPQMNFAHLLNNPNLNFALSPEERYKDQLAKLAEMGFTNQTVNIQVLGQAMGNVDAAVEKLLSLMY